MNNDKQQILLLNKWLKTLSKKVKESEEESNDNATDRIATLFGCMIDSDLEGWVLQHIEDYVSALEIEDAYILRHAFLRACSQSNGKLNGVNYRARLLLIPMVARAHDVSAIPLDIDIATANIFINNIQETSKASGRPSECYIPISGLFSPDDMDNIRPAHFYAMMRDCLQSMGIHSEMNPLELTRPNGKRVFKKQKAFTNIESRGPRLIQWTGRPEVEDTSIFTEDISTSMGFRVGSKSSSQSTCARFMPLIWIAPEEVLMPDFFSEKPWLSRASELLTQGLMCAGSVFQEKAQSKSNGDIANFDRVLSDDFSLSMLGACYPLAASNRMRGEMLGQQISSALRWCVSNLESKDHWKANEVREAFVLYDVENGVLSIILGNDFNQPDIKMKAENSAWLYPFMSKISEELEDVGFDSVKVKVTDHSIQSPIDIGHFKHIH